MKIKYLLILSFILSCSKDVDVSSHNDDNSIGIIDEDNFEINDWTTESHSNDVNPNYSQVFDNSVVKRIDLVITAERWQSMLDNITDLYGEFNSGGGPGGGGPGGGGPGGGGPGGGGLVDVDEDPIFVPAEVFYNGKQWYRVGVRFKGNSSLQRTWQQGLLKLSFKLDFDEFEDTYPQILNQRFYGFKKLHLKNNFDDKSMMREKVAGDVFRMAGLAASRTSFYTVYVDHGNGPTYFGVYTLVEDVEDTLLKDYFDSNNGNLYKPDGNAATFAAGTFNASQYEKKTNVIEADFSDVSNLLSVLNDNTRTTNPSEWRTNLDAIFDTTIFLKYLAANTVIQNWDTYGNMTHNYYLYNNPNSNKLTWIPWDNNEALKLGNMSGSLPLDFSGLNSSEWPLIGYLFQDEIYKSIYDSYVQEIIDGPFNASTTQAQYAAYLSILESHATSELPNYTFLNNSSEFQSNVNQLNTHVLNRTSAVNDYLNQ